MDNLTHSLVGALVGQAGLKRKTGLAMPALVIGANLPDVDAACLVYGIENLSMRRGITHGPIAWVLLPLVLAGLLWGWDRWQAKRGKRPEGRAPVRFGWLYALAFIACLTHPALDWLNVYGIRLLEPFSSEWFYGDTLFIVDVWLWVGLGFATWLSLRREKRGGEWRHPARIALAAGLTYIGLNYAISAADRLTDTSFEESISLPVPVAFWQRQTIGIDGSGGYWLDGKELGDIALDRCELGALRRSDARVEAFLFWSRAPFVKKGKGGGWVLHDARFYDARARGQFAVDLPEGTCREPPG